MTSNQLKSQLESLKAYKTERVRIGKVAIDYHLLLDLIKLCHPQSGVSHQACWCLEQSYLLEPECLNDYLAPFSALFELEINSSGMRPLCKIASMMTHHYYGKKDHYLKTLLKLDYRERILNGCFNQLITSDKAANLAFSINALYDLGKEYDWVYEQLIPILHQKLDEGYTVGFQSIARKTLKKLGH